MSSKKITAADKVEIVDLYRQAGDTTASLANRYGVSNSTISRILKTSIPEAEYEILIQQKRGLKAGEENLTPTIPIVTAELNDPIPETTAEPEPIVISPDLPVISFSPAEDSPTRKQRRRSSALLTVDDPVVENELSPAVIDRLVVPTAPIAKSIGNNIDPLTITPTPTAHTPGLREILADSEHRYSPQTIAELSPDISSEDLEEDDDDTEDVNVLAAMFGEEIADDDDDDDDDDDESTTADQSLDPHQLLKKDRLHVQITPLSQATLPRTCYIVIDKFAELIVRPLKDFADLGQIAGEETQQRTLPIFDNPRVAKRFSNQRTQRVIKVPDSRVFYKTTQHLKSKGITRLLVDGNIYSLN